MKILVRSYKKSASTVVHLCHYCIELKVGDQFPLSRTNYTIMPAENALNIKRGQIRGTLSRFRTYFNSLVGKEDVDIANLEHRLSNIEPLLQQFEEVQSAIEMHDDMEYQNSTQTRQLFENEYYNLITSASKMISENRPSASVANKSSNTLSAQIRLPRIKLPTFNGSYEQWFPFYDTFVSLIHDNVELTGIQKFLYLRSSVQGEAKSILQSLEISANNYFVAWNLLKCRYYNKRIIVKTHIRALFDIPVVEKESASMLRKVVDETRKHLQALRALSRPTDDWDDVIVHLIATKIDPTTNKEWEGTLSTEYPTLNNMLKFIERKCQTLECIAKQIPMTNIPTQILKARKPSYYSSTQGSQCDLCNQDHLISQCQVFLKMPIEKRLAEIKSRRLCPNCLKSNHPVFKCAASRCVTCNRKHHSLLHNSDLIKTTSSTTEASLSSASCPAVFNSEAIQQSVEPPGLVSSNHSIDEAHGSPQVILSTALIYASDIDGNLHTCRALLDCGSQSNFISASLLNKLRLPVKKTRISLTGISNTSSVINQTTEVQFSSRFNSFTAKIDCLVLNRITENLPLASIDRESMQIPPNLRLADPNFFMSGPIEVLIGADTFWSLLCVGQIKSKHHPLLQKTQFSWIVAGKMTAPGNQSIASCNMSPIDSAHKSI